MPEIQLQDLLRDKQSTILEQWVARGLATYPEQASMYLKKKKDRFGNPLGYAIANALSELYQVLLGDKELAAVQSVLEQLVKVRAVQEFSPSQAVAFLTEIKPLVADAFRKAAKAEVEMDQWLLFSKTVDQIMLQAFDLYMASRERLYQVRIKELKSGTHILTDGAMCPSAFMRKNKDRQENDLKTVNIHSSQEAR